MKSKVYRTGLWAFSGGRPVSEVKSRSSSSCAVRRYGVSTVGHFATAKALGRRFYPWREWIPSSQSQAVRAVVGRRTCLVVVLRRFPARIPMMQPNQPRHRNHGRRSGRFRLQCPSVRRVLVWRIVGPIFLMIGHVLPDQPPKMLFVERDHVVQKFVAAAPDPTLGDPILPGRMNTGPFTLQARRLQ